MTTANKISWGLGAIVSLATIGSIWYWVSKDKKKEEEEEEKYQDVFYPPDLLKLSNLNTREALRRANNIYTAMKGVGTDEMAIFRAQYKANNDGLRYIYNLFGIRDGMNMGQWFTSEMEGEDLSMIRGQWLLTGITPPF